MLLKCEVRLNLAKQIISVKPCNYINKSNIVGYSDINTLRVKWPVLTSTIVIGLKKICLLSSIRIKLRKKSICILKKWVSNNYEFLFTSLDNLKQCLLFRVRVAMLNSNVHFQSPGTSLHKQQLWKQCKRSMLMIRNFCKHASRSHAFRLRSCF